MASSAAMTTSKQKRGRPQTGRGTPHCTAPGPRPCRRVHPLRLAHSPLARLTPAGTSIKKSATATSSACGMQSMSSRPRATRASTRRWRPTCPRFTSSSALTIEGQWDAHRSPLHNLAVPVARSRGQSQPSGHAAIHSSSSIGQTLQYTQFRLVRFDFRRTYYVVGR